MASTMSWTGGAQAVAQIDHITPTNPAVGSIYTLTLNGKTVTYTCTVATIANAVAGLAAAWNASTEGEFGEITAANATTYMTLTADTKGVPFTSPTVAATGTSSGGVSEIQQVSLPAGVSAGTWQLTVRDSSGTAATTTGVAWNVSAADLQTALEALSNLAPGDVTIGEPTDGTYTLTFGGTYANYNLAAAVPVSALSGIATITPSTPTQGVAQTDEIQTITLPTTCTGGTFTLTYGGQTTSGLPHNALGTAVDTALEFLSTIGAGNVAVTGSAGGPYTATFGGTLGGTNVVAIASTSYLILTDSIDVTTAQAGAAGTNEQQVVTPTTAGGTFTLTFSSYTTTGIAWNGNAATVQAALQALTSIGTNNATVAGTGPYTVTFTGTMHSLNQPALTSAAYWTGAIPLATATPTPGVAGTNEQQTVTPTAAGGTFTLGFSGYTSTGIAWNAADSAVESALEALASIGASNVTVTGSGPYTVTFTGTMHSANQPAMTSAAYWTGETVIATATSTGGVAGTNERQQATIVGTPTGGHWHVVFGGATSTNIAWNDAPSTVQTILQTGPMGSGNVTVTGTTTSVYTLTFTGSLHSANQAEITINNSLTAGASLGISETTKGAAEVPAVPKIEDVDWSGLTVGTFYVSYLGGTTGTLQWDADASTVNTALQAINGSCNGVGHWTHTTAGENTASTSDNPGVTITQYQAWAALIPAVNEVQLLVFTTPTGGTYTLSYLGETSAAIAWNDISATVQGALEQVTTIATGQVSVGGNYGTGFDITFTGTLAATDIDLLGTNNYLLYTAPDVTVATLTEGIAGTNEVQTFTFSTAPIGGTYTLSFSGETTGSIAWNATSATVDAALEALTGIGAGNIAVTGTYGGGFAAAFQGARHSANQAQITANSGSVILGTPAPGIATTTPGGPGGNEVQTFTFTTYPIGGTYTLSFSGETTGSIAWNALIATVQSELESLTGIGAGNIAIAGFYGAGDGTYCMASFQGARHSATQAQITANGGSLIINTPAPGISTTTPGATGINEIQYVQVGNGSAPRSGTFTLTFNGYTTTALNFNATAAQTEAALEALTSISAGNVDVTKPDATYFIVTFQGALHSANQATITGDSNALVVQLPIPTIATPTPGVAGVNEVQSISMSPTVATGGTYTLTFGAEETAAINYNANASQVQAALEALTGIAVADVVVAGGPLTSGAFTLTFGGLLANSNVGQVSVTSAVLTPLSSIAVSTLTAGAAGSAIGVAASTANSGPKVWSVAANWSGSTVPVTGDTVYFENCDVDCLYGIDQSAVTLAAMRVEKSYTGEIGLPNQNANGYREYRTKELTIGITDGWFVGGGGRYRINTGSIQTTLRIDGTGSSNELDLPAMLWRGTNANNVVSINKGSLGIALFAGETATVATLTTGQIDSQDSDVDLELSSGVSLTTFNCNGGEIEMDCGCTTLTQTGGTITHTNGNITTLTVLSGNFYPRGSSTYTTTVIGAGGLIDNTANTQSPTFTTITINGGGSLYDPYERATFSNAVTLRGEAVVSLESGQVQLGHSITLVRGNAT